MKFLPYIIFLLSVICATAHNIPVEELRLPSVPDSLRTPAKRAAYVVTHFWDDMDFRDTARSHDQSFMEQNFVNYLSLFPHTPADTLKVAIPQLMRLAEADTVAYNLLADMADKYLYDTESPMLDEESYIIFLETIMNREFMEPARRSRFEYEWMDALKNRKGSKADDFEFIDSDGNKSTLYKSGDGTSSRILLFYDPDCDHCHEVIEMLKNDDGINKKLQSGEISILAIYSDGDAEIWDRSKNSLPPAWRSGYSPDNAIETQELYVLRRMPTLYYIDPDNTVLLKDPTAEQLIQFILQP